MADRAGEAAWRADLAAGKFDATDDVLAIVDGHAEEAIRNGETAVLIRARTVLRLTSEIRRRREQSAAKPAESEVAELRAEVARLQCLLVEEISK